VKFSKIKSVEVSIIGWKKKRFSSKRGATTTSCDSQLHIFSTTKLKQNTTKIHSVTEARQLLFKFRLVKLMSKNINIIKLI